MTRFITAQHDANSGGEGDSGGRGGGGEGGSGLESSHGTTIVPRKQQRQQVAAANVPRAIAEAEGDGALERVTTTLGEGRSSYRRSHAELFDDAGASSFVRSLCCVVIVLRRARRCEHTGVCLRSVRDVGFLRRACARPPAVRTCHSGCCGCHSSVR